MRLHDVVTPTLAEAHARIDAIRPDDYARTRNALDGAVTGLSPYITHGFVDLPAIVDSVVAKHGVGPQHRFMFELGWREFFHHVRQKRGDAIFGSMHPGPLPEEAYVQALHADLREARAGVPAIDAAVRMLYDTGYLHNHARLWLASYVVHFSGNRNRAGLLIGQRVDALTDTVRMKSTPDARQLELAGQTARQPHLVVTPRLHGLQAQVIGSVGAGGNVLQVRRSNVGATNLILSVRLQSQK